MADSGVITAGRMVFNPHYPGSVVDVDPMSETRCPYCNLLFFAGRMAPGSAIEIRCRKCKSFVKIKAV